MYKNFINNIVLDKDLSTFDKVLLIFFYNNKKENVNIITGFGQRHIINNLNIGKSTLLRSLKHLENLNYLRKIRRKVLGTKSFASNYYILAPINSNGDIDKNYIKNLDKDLDINIYNNNNHHYIKREYNKNYICY